MKDYEVGYMKPPKNSRFQPGESGNKSGRPKGRKKLDINHILEKELLNTVVTKDGQRMTKLEVAIKQIVNKSATGDLNYSKLLLPMIDKLNDFDLSKLFCDKLIKDGFINPEDMRNYVYDNKNLVVNKKLTATDKIDYGIFRRKTMAFESVKNVFILNNVYLLITYVLISNEIFIAIETEKSFWDGVKSSFELLNTPERKRSEILKDLENTREYNMPTADLYETAIDFKNLSFKEIILNLNKFIETQKDYMYYEEQKRYWFSDENQSKFYTKLKDEKVSEYIDNFQKADISFYNRTFLPCAEGIKIDSDKPTFKKLLALINWYRGK